MLIRSFLYAPANRPDRLAQVATCGADAIVLDLEDAVSAAEKAAAREAVAEFLDRGGDAPALPVFVRVNAGEAAIADLAALPLHKVTGIRLPKVRLPTISVTVSYGATAGDATEAPAALLGDAYRTAQNRR